MVEAGGVGLMLGGRWFCGGGEPGGRDAWLVVQAGLARLSRAVVVRCPVVMALNRLCTAQVNVHSAAALGLPRRESWRKRMLCLICPWGVSAMWPRWR